jgi:hypothetical protein
MARNAARLFVAHSKPATVALVGPATVLGKGSSASAPPRFWPPHVDVYVGVNIQPGGLAHFFTVWVGLSIGAPRLCIRRSEPVICSRHGVWIAPVLPPLAGVRPGHPRWRGLRHRMGVQKGLGCRQTGPAGAARRPARAVACMAEAAPMHDQRDDLDELIGGSRERILTSRAWRTHWRPLARW